MAFKNVEDRRAYHKKWYEANKAKCVDKARKQRQRIIAFIAESKQNGCSKCAENHPACLDYHHTDATTKSFAIADAPKLGYGIKKVQEEIDKCILVCANCHRKEHYNAALA